jgi:putative inorganic carbon (hco3(-)) transporter
MLLPVLLILIFTRPFISSLAFPCANAVHVTLLLGVILIWILRQRLSTERIMPLQYPLLLFVLALGLSTAFAQERKTAVTELYPYAQGILLLVIAASLSPAGKKRIIGCIAISSFLISLLAIYQYFFGFGYLLKFVAKKGITDAFVLDYIGRRRPFLPFVTPNILAGYLAMIIPLFFAFKKKIWAVIPLFCALMMTKSLGALASLFAGLSIYLALRKGKKKLNIIVLASLFAMAILVLFARLGMPHVQARPLFSAMMRLSYWRETFSIIATHPFFGVGPGNFNLMQARYAHNAYLQLWAETGILGVIAVLWLAFAVIRHGLRALKNDPRESPFLIALICANSIFLIHNLVDFSFFLPEINLTWWVLAGLLFL